MPLPSDSTKNRQKPATPEIYIPDRVQHRILGGLIGLIAVCLFLDLVNGIWQ